MAMKEKIDIGLETATGSGTGRERKKEEQKSILEKCCGKKRHKSRREKNVRQANQQAEHIFRII